MTVFKGIKMWYSIVVKAQAWEPDVVQVPALLLTSCVTLGKLLNLSAIQSPYLQRDHSNSIFLRGLLRCLNEFLYVNYYPKLPFTE